MQIKRTWYSGKKFELKLQIELEPCNPTSSSKFSKAYENLDACFNVLMSHD